MVRLVFQSDYKTMANIALSYTSKGHNGDVKVKVKILFVKTTFPHLPS